MEENNVSSCELLAGHNVHESMQGSNHESNSLVAKLELKSGV